MRAIALLLVVAACTPSPTQPTSAVSADASVEAAAEDYHPSLMATACTEDSDCAVTNFTGCCAACPGAISAVSRTELERQQKACAAVECAPPQGRVRCEPAERADQYRAVCRDKVCQAVKSTTAESTPPATTCSRDDECAISSQRGCCSPCASPPFADLKRNVDALKSRCAAVRCAQPTEPQECKPTEDPSVYRAVCQSSACAMVRNAPVPPQQLTSAERCAKDDECAVSNFASCCSPCQSSAYATSKKALDARNQRCAVVDCAAPGNVTCDPIVDASLYRAVCRGGTCGGVKR